MVNSIVEVPYPSSRVFQLVEKEDTVFKWTYHGGNQVTQCHSIIEKHIQTHHIYTKADTHRVPN